ncbi:MAG: hypothetical protein CBC13_06755 [Planctomycetia bacterium TMED53]|nr:MAG: hypothetical protein CBC13_06755 [Planctomycetia bacterium TMED53]
MGRRFSAEKGSTAIFTTQQFLQHCNFYNTAISTTLQLFNWERRFTDIDFARQWRRGILRSTLAPGCSSKKQEYSRFGAREPERPIFAQKAGLVRASISPMYMGAGHLDLSSWIWAADLNRWISRFEIRSL